MAYTLSPVTRLLFIDANGAPRVGAQLFTYASGTTTHLATYGAADGSSSNLNPMIVNASGTVGPIYLLPQAYKFVLAPAGDTDPPSSPIETTDPVNAVPETNVYVDVTGTAGETLTSEKAVYLSSGSGGLTAGRWYLMDASNAYASIAALATGMTTAAIASGSSGSIRILGRVTNLAGLTVGSAYYASSSTPGAITATPPANARVVGIADSTISLTLSVKRDDDIRRVATFASSVGNVGAGEDTLASYVSGAQGLYATGMAYEGRFWGTTANNVNAKTIRLRMLEGANNIVVASFAATASEAGMWDLSFTILRKAATDAAYVSQVAVGPQFGPTSRIGTNSVAGGTVTWDNSVELRLTGEATTTDDIVCFGGIIRRVGFGP